VSEKLQQTKLCDQNSEKALKIDHNFGEWIFCDPSGKEEAEWGDVNIKKYILDFICEKSRTESLKIFFGIYHRRIISIINQS